MKDVFSNSQITGRVDVKRGKVLEESRRKKLTHTHWPTKKKERSIWGEEKRKSTLSRFVCFGWTNFNQAPTHSKMSILPPPPHTHITSFLFPSSTQTPLSLSLSLLFSSSRDNSQTNKQTYYHGFFLHPFKCSSKSNLLF